LKEYHFYISDDHFHDLDYVQHCFQLLCNHLKEWHGMETQGRARKGKEMQGMVWHGKPRKGMACKGKTMQGMEWKGMQRQGMAGQGMAGHVMAWNRKASQGKAIQGKI
jgi:hypothetical protein